MSETDISYCSDILILRPRNGDYMDFSRKGVIKKQHQLKSMPKRLTSKFRISLYRIAVLTLAAVIMAGCIAGYAAVKGMVESAPDITSLDIDPEGYTTFMYYSDGSVSGTLVGAEANRVYVNIEDIPKHVQDAFVALEDERFYEHNGIDIRGILRAAVSVLNTRSLDYGASTITQQLLKNKVFGGGDEEEAIDKITRKVQEQFLAIKLENMFSKKEILEAYLNYVNLGNSSFGVQMAAMNYYGKDISEVTLSEAAALAPMCYSPVLRNPITHQDGNKDRRQKCLDLMLENNMCTKEEYDAAIEDTDNLYERINLYAQEKGAASYLSYFQDSMITQILEDLQKECGYTREEAYKLLYSGGLQIYSTQDKEVQSIVDKYYTDESYFPEVGKGSFYYLDSKYAISVYAEDGSVKHYHIDDFLNYFSDYNDSKEYYYHGVKKKKGISQYTINKEDMEAKLQEFRNSIGAKENNYVENYATLILQPQSTITIINQKTGAIVAIYGGRGEKTANRTFNRAASSVRNVGSTFKVLAAFLPALDTGKMTLATVADDAKYFYPGTETEVDNWWGSTYRGLHPIREGIYRSMNIVACKIMERVTPEVAFEYLEKLGFSTLVRNEVMEDGKRYSDLNIALALGGLTKGVTNVELTAAYAAIANEGVYNEPIYYVKVLDHNGRVLLTNEDNVSRQVIKTSTAWLLTDAMEDTVTIGTGTRLRFKEYKMPVAGKTGTTTKNNDLWFSGYTPYYTASVWTGFDNKFSQINKSYHQELWRMIMEEIHSKKQLEYKEFVKPSSILQAEVCLKCGNLAVKGLCDKAQGGSTVSMEYFAKGTEPTKECTCHEKVLICSETKLLANIGCPDVKEAVLLKKEETCETWDTPNVLPKEHCNVHGGGGIGDNDPNGGSTGTDTPDGSDNDINNPDGGNNNDNNDINNPDNGNNNDNNTDNPDSGTGTPDNDDNIGTDTPDDDSSNNDNNDTEGGISSGGNNDGTNNPDTSQPDDIFPDEEDITDI